MMNYLAVTLFAFLINIPCGMIRSRFPKLSLPWFFWIHASIPFIIYLRYQLNISHYFIPISIGVAILGQLVGQRIANRQLNN